MKENRRREWIFPEEGSEEQDCPGVHPVIAGVLKRRGVLSREDMEEFLSDRPRLTYDPFLMKDMQAAVEVIADAVDKGERICIYGDYDADGVTSSSLLYTLLGRVTENLDYYIPCRFEEGYGLNKEAVRSIAAEGTRLLITVDCGSVSGEEVELAKELGMRVIVTDHHNIKGGRAADCLLINPKQEDCPYPFKELAGCGVAFKLAQALQRYLEAGGDDRIKKGDVTDLLDLVAVATIGDIVPLVRENRSLVKYGLNVLNQGKRPGLRALIKGVGLKLGAVTSEQVAFVIVPHLNAAGRMISAKKGVELLTLQDPGPEGDRARAEAVAFLAENNKERKRIQEETYEACVALMMDGRPDDLFQVIYAEEAHEGIAGIVAGKIKDLRCRPVVVVTPAAEGFLKGTGRSVEGVDLYRLLEAHSHLFQRFGGHSGACGFLMAKENLEALREGLSQAMEELVRRDPEALTERICVDGLVEASEVTMDFLKETSRLGPFGHKNPEPLFAVRQGEIRKVAFMGERSQHARFQLAGPDGGVLGCILFQNAALYEELLREGARADAVGRLDINVWNGVAKIQFVITDLR